MVDPSITAPAPEKTSTLRPIDRERSGSTFRLGASSEYLSASASCGGRPPWGRTWSASTWRPTRTSMWLDVKGAPSKKRSASPVVQSQRCSGNASSGSIHRRIPPPHPAGTSQLEYSSSTRRADDFS